MTLPPKVSDFAAFRALTAYEGGAFAMCSSSIAGSNRTISVSSSALAPAPAYSARAFGLSTFMPMSRSTRSDAWWIASI